MDNEERREAAAADESAVPAEQAVPTDDVVDPRQTNPYADVYSNFVEQTKDHVLTVSQDSGLRRQLRVGAPGSGIWSWGVITWPGYLATFGDVADGYMFTRDDDMLWFFTRPEGAEGYYSDGAPSIDFRYWAQKLCGSRSGDVKVFSEKVFHEVVEEAIAGSDDLGPEAVAEYDRVVAVAQDVCRRNGVAYEDYLAQLHAKAARAKRSMHFLHTDTASYPLLDLSHDPESEVEQEYFGRDIPVQSPRERAEDLRAEARHHDWSREEAVRWMEENEDVFGADPWEHDLTEFDSSFVLACYALDLTTRLWREHKRSNDAKALRLDEHQRARALVDAARTRVGEGFKVRGHGEVGEPSNGALLSRLADALEAQIVSRPAYVRQAPALAGSDYVLVEGGLVQNDPALPVFDLDVLGSEVLDQSPVDEAISLFGRIAGHDGLTPELEDALRRTARFVRSHGEHPEDAELIEKRLVSLGLDIEAAPGDAS